MTWNAINWNAPFEHSSGYMELMDVLTPAALGGSAAAVQRALTAYAEADLRTFTRDEQLTLDELMGDVHASEYRLACAAHPVKRPATTRHPQRRLAI